jgi:hypothetical protein
MTLLKYNYKTLAKYSLYVVACEPRNFTKIFDIIINSITHNTKNYMYPLLINETMIKFYTMQLLDYKRLLNFVMRAYNTHIESDTNIDLSFVFSKHKWSYSYINYIKSQLIRDMVKKYPHQTFYIEQFIGPTKLANFTVTNNLRLT